MPPGRSFRANGTRQEAVEAGAAPALGRLLSGPSRTAAAAAAAALRNASEHPRARRALSALMATLPPAQQVGGQIYRMRSPGVQACKLRGFCRSPTEPGPPYVTRHI